MSIAQQIMLKSTDYLQRIFAPVGGQGGVTLSYLCPNMDNDRALDVGELHRGTGTFKVRKPKVPEGGVGCCNQGKS